MSEPETGPEEAGPQPPPADKEAWKLVYFGQLSRDLVPFHPDPPETPEDELTQAALSDPDGVNQDETAGSGPTFWRVLAVVAIAIFALAMVFWRTR